MLGCGLEGAHHFDDGSLELNVATAGHRRRILHDGDRSADSRALRQASDHALLRWDGEELAASLEGHPLTVRRQGRVLDRPGDVLRPRLRLA